MRRAAICGAVAAAGLFLCCAAGAKHPALDWTEVALIVGAMLAVWGFTNIRKEMEDANR